MKNKKYYDFVNWPIDDYVYEKNPLKLQRCEISDGSGDGSGVEGQCLPHIDDSYKSYFFYSPSCGFSKGSGHGRGAQPLNNQVFFSGSGVGIHSCGDEGFFCDYDAY